MTLEVKSVENGFDNPIGGKDNAPFIGGVFVPSKVEYAIAPGGANVAEVTITLKNGHGGPILGGVLFNVWLSDNMNAVGLTATTASGTVIPKSASGALFGTLTAKKALLVQTLVDGTFILQITDTAKTGFIIGVQNPFSGLNAISDQLQTADYGA